MKSKYFCAFHSVKMQACESSAIQSWTEMMRRGVQAYVACRLDSANIYLNSAFDIALLRQSCEENGIFNELHLCKPAEFLIQLFLIDNNFDQAIILLSRLSTIENLPGLNEFLSTQYERVELAEKTYLRSSNTKQGLAQRIYC